MRATKHDFEEYDTCTDDLRRIDYLPSPADIADACASIRSRWTRSEQRRRFVGELVPDESETAWVPPTIDTSQFSVVGRWAVDTAS